MTVEGGVSVANVGFVGLGVMVGVVCGFSD